MDTSNIFYILCSYILNFYRPRLQSKSVPKKKRKKKMDLTRDKLKSGLTQFYTLLTKAPYIDSSSVLHPPPGQKWHNICEEELHKRGKNAEIIEILHHLPYLKYSDSEHTERCMIGPHSHAITYCEGDIYSEELDVIQPTPAHCIWLASPAESEDGIGLILDIKNGKFGSVCASDQLLFDKMIFTLSSSSY